MVFVRGGNADEVLLPVLEDGEVVQVVLTVDGDVSRAAVSQDHGGVRCFPST